MGQGKKLNGTLREFIENQVMFFVATADETGRVNVSPKGLDSLRIMDDNRIIWLNLSGSGNETAAHVAATGRMTLMFCAFDGDPMILRTYGTARVFHPRDPEWNMLAQHFPPMAGSRQIFDLTIDLVQTSCGTGVPIMDFQRSRGETELVPYFDDLGADGVDGKPTGIFATKA
ncbi:pyridoxamine 5'-phosphate oxidase [Amylibacter ulvae]|uniref:Pyridoxamine 5'-phosphate oxidase n=1 Tax=Paramylibacter ulvae TaxID=1651968 RepID=A0ABQ3CXR3_9RHOB|nr:pyridoxamine 5'-phosphate oxidase family protein [Amylibacter ulvae]GHA47917.1 pyridoxamine 5'-phosphate oxidase [Amylibacter ulvae]